MAFRLPGLPSNFTRFTPGADIILAAGVVAIVAVLIVPLPGPILDFALSISITLSVLILMVAIFLHRPLDLSSFPTLLLLTTLLRLSLNVATTRLILAHGHEGKYAAGRVVAAFGSFLMGSDVVIGVILFAILLIINFVVITKGSGRIAEVAARFSLDAMPGKQMAIDAELGSGAINEATARIRRKDLEEETAFYGAMDGAAKFVRGDAVAGVIITAINIIGGFATGLLRHHMSFADAISTYTTLTVGDGLVSQIPALLVSIAAGIVVTKGGLEGGTDAALMDQLASRPKPLAMASVGALMLAFMPGLPAIPFLMLAGLAGGGAWYAFTRPPKPVGDAVIDVAPSEPTISQSLRLDLVRIELGFGLLSLASGDQPRLTEQIKGLRRAVASEMGFVMPAIRIQDNLQLAADDYVIRIKEIEAGRGSLRPTGLLVMDPSGQMPTIPGEPTIEPTFGLPAVWIAPEFREEAVFAGCTVVDAASVLTTHLTELVKQNMSELLSYVETQKLLEDLPQEQQKLIGDLVPSLITNSGIQRVLQALLIERVSIRDLPTILEGIQEACTAGQRGTATIVATVRTRLARQISEACRGSRGYIPIIPLSPEWEVEFASTVIGPAEDRQLTMAPSKLAEFSQAVRGAVDSAIAAGDAPVLLTSAAIRPQVRMIVERLRPEIPVLAQVEISPRARIRTVGSV